MTETQTKLVAKVLKFAIIFAIALVIAADGYDRGWHDGTVAADKRHAEDREEHDRIMRKIGVCSWAKVVAAQVQCKSEFKPGEE